MQHNKESVEHPRRGHLRIAAESLLQFIMRSLTPVNRSLSAAREAPPLPEDDRLMRGRKQKFCGELFAELLIELPVHRQRLAHAGEHGDIDTLGNTVHQLLGAVAYCDAPELEDALRELRLAIKTGNRHTIDIYQDRAINVIDSTLRYSGYRSHG
jgi:hypothetical protein